MKFRKKKRIAYALGKILASNLPLLDFDCVIPVPLHANRLKERGFNQSEIISRPIAEKAAVPLYANALIRIKETKPQFSLRKRDRILNVKNAFIAGCPDTIKGKQVLLVDDIYTTGSTVNECKKCLLNSGAQSVNCAVLSRPPVL